MIEVLIFDLSWFTKHTEDHDSLRNLADLINKSYAKPMHKYEVVLTHRVSDYKNFVDSFKGAKSKNFNLFVALMSEETNNYLKEKGLNRKFTRENKTINDAFDFDIPKQFIDQFDVKRRSFNFKKVSIDFVFNESILSRALGTLALNSETPSLYDLTAFTSYLKSFGPVFMEAVVYRYLLSIAKSNKITFLASCFREHQLVEYYQKKCGFSLTGESDVILRVAEPSRTRSPVEDTLRFQKDINIAFMFREFTSEYS